MKASEAFNVRNQSVTCTYQNSLLMRSKIGQIAFGLFRAQKRSTLAKTYRRNLRHKSYDAKNDALKYLDACLTLWGDDLGFRWGWQRDRQQEYHNQVLYFECDQFGQASFHSDRAISKKTFPGQWDSRKGSQEVILTFCDHVTDTVSDLSPLSDDDVFPFGKHCGLRFCDIPHTYFDWLRNWDGLSEWSSLRDYIDMRCSSRT
jgi:hypothetical protein